MARILIVAGGCRGLRLAGELIAEGHAVRITTRSGGGRAAIEATGAECWIGDPARLATLRGVLDGVAVTIWALGTANGPVHALQELHAERAAFFATQAIDSTVRRLIYEAGGAEGALLAQGATAVRAVAERNAIPLSVVDADPVDFPGWSREVHDAIEKTL